MARKVCLFGGSFDPIHTGHLHLAKEAHAHLGLDLVLFLPAACSPFKLNSSPRFDVEERLEMLNIATQDLDWAEVSRLDLELPPPSWSWRIVQHVLAKEPDVELYWLLGLDQWQELEKWSQFDYLAEKLHFIVYHRDGQPQPKAGVKATFLSGAHPASSSRIRDLIQQGEALPPSWIVEGTEALLLRHQGTSTSH